MHTHKGHTSSEMASLWIWHSFCLNSASVFNNPIKLYIFWKLVIQAAWKCDLLHLHTYCFKPKISDSLHNGLIFDRSLIKIRLFSKQNYNLCQKSWNICTISVADLVVSLPPPQSNVVVSMIKRHKISRYAWRLVSGKSTLNSTLFHSIFSHLFFLVVG